MPVSLTCAWDPCPTPWQLLKRLRTPDASRTLVMHSTTTSAAGSDHVQALHASPPPMRQDVRSIHALYDSQGVPVLLNRRPWGTGADAVIATDEVEDVPAKVKEITGGKLAYAVRACPQLVMLSWPCTAGCLFVGCITSRTAPLHPLHRRSVVSRPAACGAERAGSSKSGCRQPRIARRGLRCGRRPWTLWRDR